MRGERSKSRRREENSRESASNRPQNMLWTSRVSPVEQLLTRPASPWLHRMTSQFPSLRLRPSASKFGHALRSKAQRGETRPAARKSRGSSCTYQSRDHPEKNESLAVRHVRATE